MINTSRRARWTKARAEALAMLAAARPQLPARLPGPSLDREELLFVDATEFCAALDAYAARAKQIKSVNH